MDDSRHLFIQTAQVCLNMADDVIHARTEYTWSEVAIAQQAMVSAARKIPLPDWTLFDENLHRTAYVRASEALAFLHKRKEPTMRPPTIPALLYSNGEIPDDCCAPVQIDAAYHGTSPETVGLRVTLPDGHVNLALEPDNARRLIRSLGDALRERDPEIEPVALKLLGSAHSQIFMASRAGPSHEGVPPMYTVTLSAGTTMQVIAAMLRDLWHQIGNLFENLALLAPHERKLALAAVAEVDESFVKVATDFATEPASPLPSVEIHELAVATLTLLAEHARRRADEVDAGDPIHT